MKYPYPKIRQIKLNFSPKWNIKNFWSWTKTKQLDWSLLVTSVQNWMDLKTKVQWYNTKIWFKKIKNSQNWLKFQVSFWKKIQWKISTLNKTHYFVNEIIFVTFLLQNQKNLFIRYREFELRTKISGLQI